MATMEDMRLRNREVSIMFMQQEHSNTLKGLHEEIEKLQKRCSDLQFQLAMEATYTSQEDEFREKCEQLEKQVKTHERAMKEKSEKLEKKENRIENLEQQVRAVEKKYKDELREKQKVINRLQNDLEEKCDQIANLQMAPLTARTITAHQHKGHAQGQIQGQSTDRYRHQHQSLDSPLSSHSSPKHLVDRYLDPDVHVAADKSSKSGYAARRLPTPEQQAAHRLSRESSGSSQHSHEDGELTGALHMPMPPAPPRTGSGGASKSGGATKSRRRMVTAQTTPHFAEVRFRPASAKRLENTAPVDTEEILQIAREQRGKFDIAVNAGRIIPPIKNKSDEASLGLPRPNPRQTNSAAFHKKSRGTSKLSTSQLEVETLAVDHVISKDLRKAQEFNSYGSDA